MPVFISGYTWETQQCCNDSLTKFAQVYKAQWNKYCKVWVWSICYFAINKTSQKSRLFFLRKIDICFQATQHCVLQVSTTLKPDLHNFQTRLHNSSINNIHNSNYVLTVMTWVENANVKIPLTTKGSVSLLTLTVTFLWPNLSQYVDRQGIVLLLMPSLINELSKIHLVKYLG